MLVGGGWVDCERSGHAEKSSLQRDMGNGNICCVHERVQMCCDVSDRHDPSLWVLMEKEELCEGTRAVTEYGGCVGRWWLGW